MPSKAKAYKIPIPCSGPQKKQTNGQAKYRFVRADNVDYHPLPFGLQRSLTQLFRALHARKKERYVLPMLCEKGTIQA
jgi:hypothetical protein